MWNLGCILFEFAELRPPFSSDWDVQRYDRNSEDVCIDLSPSSPITRAVTAILKRLLHRDRGRRPSSEECSFTLESYTFKAGFDLVQPLRASANAIGVTSASLEVTQYIRVWAWLPAYKLQFQERGRMPLPSTFGSANSTQFYYVRSLYLAFSPSMTTSFS